LGLLAKLGDTIDHGALLQGATAAGGVDEAGALSPSQPCARIVLGCGEVSLVGFAVKGLTKVCKRRGWAMKFSVAHRLEAYPGETVIGDRVVVDLKSDRPRLLFAIIDGLGHGKNAAHAADVAEQTLLEQRDEDDILVVMRAIHASLRGTRGAAATVCIADDNHLSCCGVGNVALRSHGADVPFVLSPGILGSNVRLFRKVEATLSPKQRIVLHSDGIASSLELGRLAHLDTKETCESIFRTHRKKNDDSALLVIDVGD
jgi:negative regulator of sigma-B (phosphoserine phosphatase)